MAVDELIRSAFAEHDEAWDQRTRPALERVHEQARRRSVVRRRVAAAALAAVLVPTALVVGSREPAQDPVATQPGSPDTGRASAGSAQPLDGEWRTAPVTDADVRRTLEAAGLGRWTDQLLAQLPPRPFVVAMTIGDRRINASLVGPDGRARHVDGQTTNVVDDELRLSAFWSQDATSYRWRRTTRMVGSDSVSVLSLELEATTEREGDGIPGEVWQRVIYTSGDFVDTERSPGQVIR